MRLSLLILPFLLHSYILSGQDDIIITKEAIDEQIAAAVKLGPAGNTNEVLEMAEKAFEDSKITNYDEGVLRAGSLLTVIYTNTYNFEKVIERSKDIEKIALKNKDYNRLSNAVRLRAIAYLELGLTDSGEKELFKSLEYTQKMPEHPEKYYRLAMLYDNLGELMDAKGIPVDSVMYYKNKSLATIEKVDDSEEIFRIAKYSMIAFNKASLGFYHSKLNEIDKAEKYFLEAIELYDTYEDLIQTERVIALSEASKFYLTNGEFEKSIFYAEKALNIEKNNKVPVIREALFNTLMTAYRELGKNELANEYSKLSRVLSDSLRAIERAAVNAGVSNILEEKQSAFEASKKRTFMIVMGLILLAVLVFSLLWYFHIRKVRKRYESIIKQLKNPDAEIPVEEKVNDVAVNDENKETPEFDIPQETLDELLAKLEQFEESKQFIKPEVNVGYLCNYLGTNTKYLSHILSRERQKSFTQYINDLRIDYLVKLLYSKPKYLNYKIEYLVETCGFQSRSAFNKSFKNRTGLTPSYFIKRLKGDLKSTEVV